MPEKSAIALLSKTPRSKVTVMKEIVRLAGEFGGDDSYNFLSQFTKDENLHQDVHIALLRAFWKHIHKDEVWSHFHAAATSGNTALARSTIRIPQEGLKQSGRDNLCKQLNKTNTSELFHPGVVELNLNYCSKAIETYSQQDITDLESKFRTSTNAAVRRLGLGLLIESSIQYGWTNERKEHLSEYCADNDLWISEAAGMIEPPQSFNEDS